MSRAGQWLTDRREERRARQRDARYLAASMRAADADAEPENARPPMTWRQAMKQWGMTRGKQVHRVAVQGYQRAVQAGRVAARKVIAVQKEARLPEHLMRRSAVSVAIRTPARESDAAWRDGYMRMAVRQLPELRQPEADMEAGQ